MQKKLSRALYWTPRLVSIAFIAFLTIFSFDVITSEATVWQIIGGLFMHNIPVFVLIGVLVVAWKHELVGAVAFALAGVAYLILVLTSALRNSFEWDILYSLIIAGPACIIAFLFYLNWKKKNH